jgi:hypothetical protein
MLATIIGKMIILGLLCADDSAIASFTINDVQKRKAHGEKYCRDWNLTRTANDKKYQFVRKK